MSIFCLVGGLLGTNTYIISLEGKRCFVVDPSSSAELIAQHIGNKEMDLASIVLTHGHYDHLESLVALKKRYPHASVCIHEQDSWALGSTALARHKAIFETSGLEGIYSEFYHTNNAALLPEPDFFLTEGQIFEKEWTVLHTPGHSSGSICLFHEEQNLLISGDTLFYMGWGRTDIYGGDEKKLMESLKRLSLLPENTKVYPGHGKYGFAMLQNPIM